MRLLYRVTSIIMSFLSIYLIFITLIFAHVTDILLTQANLETTVSSPITSRLVFNSINMHIYFLDCSRFILFIWEKSSMMM